MHYARRIVWHILNHNSVGAYMAIFTDGYVWQDFGAGSKFGVIANSHIPSGNCNLMIDDYSGSYFSVMSHDYTVWAMW